MIYINLQLDEAVITIIQRENHELFDFYYGEIMEMAIN
jgi:hypothetical protein